MNILQISTIDNRGGASKVAWGIKKGLEKRRLKNSMFVSHKVTNDKDVSVIPRTAAELFLSKIFATDIDFFNSDYILQTAEYENADIVHCHNLHGNYFNLDTLHKIGKEKSIVWTLHDMWAVTPHCAHVFSGKLKNGFYQCPNLKVPPAISWHNERYLQWKKQRIYDSTNIEIVVPSEWLKDKVEKSALSRQKIRLIYNGVDTEKFIGTNKIKARKILGLPPNKKIIMCSGQGGDKNYWKGWEYTVKVINYFRGNNDVIFLCLGDDYKSKISESVYNTGFINDDSVSALYYSASDVFLMTSLAENFPLVIIEAMSCGLPVVSFDVGGVKEAVIHKQNGIIVKYKNTKEVIAGIEKVISLNETNAKKISFSNRERVKKYFSLNMMVRNYLKLYEGLLETK